MNVLLEKYLNGDLNSSELKFFLENLEELSDDDALAIYNAIQKRNENPMLTSKQYDAITSKIKNRIEPEDSFKGVFSISKNWKIAASLFILIASTLVFLLFANSTITIQTGYSENKTVVLPDQSIVKLNSNSELQYKKNWNLQKQRKIWFKGEGFFDVERMENKPFKVITENVIVNVLGTEFNVNSRGKETKVYLESGKVKIEDKEDNLLEELIPGDEIIVDENENITKYQPVDDYNPTSWKDGTMSFYNISLTEILQELENIYGVKMTFNDKELMDSEYSISIPVTDFSLAKTILENLTDQELIIVN